MPGFALLGFFHAESPLCSFPPLSTYCLPFVLSNEAGKSAWKCVQYEKAMTEPDRQGEREEWERETWRNGEQDKKPACVEESNEPRNLADATAAYTSNRATLLRLPPFPLWIPLQEAWNKTVIKSTRGWRCGRQWKSKSWLEPAPLTIGLSSARVEAHPLPELHCVEVEEKE